ncbi:hypothetical protein [Fibrobacter sp. UWB12]|uniref:hypothetical protein n=1 Tax=Fibrobacter sp. UWB12 TaxID=1896203 RepID=UPI00091414C3|nr:hypothetical protein [Fibrobacter sp. UWB12]SHK43012.1 hypothetical protein SAMN05720759_102448 [Fibrobacter sp. UWB12]
MIKDESKVLDLYKHFVATKKKDWEFGNSILYKMCKENPKHNNSNIVVGKIWLIGRSYAAAIERRKDGRKTGDFYFDIVAPEMKRISKELDKKIEELSLSASENFTNLLYTHKFLTKTFNKISHLEKRSLASKYLHFHCPEKVFIYDSRARDGIHKFVERPDKSILNKLQPDKFDKEYGDFVCRVLELKTLLEENLQITLSPRDIDNFLLSDAIKNYHKENKAKKKI